MTNEISMRIERFRQYKTSVLRKLEEGTFYGYFPSLARVVNAYQSSGMGKDILTDNYFKPFILGLCMEGYIEVSKMQDEPQKGRYKFSITQKGRKEPKRLKSSSP